MKKIDNYICTNQPKKVTVYPTLVYVCESYELKTLERKIKNKDGIEQIETTNFYVCSITVYEISEYIDKLQQENEALNAQTTELQLALCEVYEMML